MMQVTAGLLGSLGAARVVGRLPPRIAALETDSRRVGPGVLFVALRGAHVDGHTFVPAAAAAGAAAVVVESELAVDVPQIVVPDTRAAISRLADAFFDRPSRDLRVVGVTGTNGKTTTVHLLEAICRAAGVPCATVGTLGAALGPQRWPLANTTPPALELQALLATLRAAGAAAVAMEVSSHALALNRVDDVRFAAAIFTNLTRDHLDFHGSLTEYARSKRRLLEMAPAAAINVDDPVGAAFAGEFPHAVSYAIDAPARVRAERLRLEPDGSFFSVDGTAIRLPLRGRFNVYNALAAFAAARALNVPDAAIGRGLAAVPAVPGRMERIAGSGIEAIVDYAHTPDALENVLRAARESTRGDVIVVFGCGGDRDRGKRAPMGEIAARLADCVIVTSDNPRSEDPAAIAQAIAAETGSEIVLDRRSAIRRAIAAAAAGDTVVVAGKGHETYQIVGDRVQAFDDRDEVRAAFAERAKARTQAVG
jgi:UDP-N-acetylmuramoyl-L-alanyl-D-glutamate--2,6-diaminopimelate ligase